MIDVSRLCEQGIREWQNTNCSTSLSSYYISEKEQQHTQEQIEKLLSQMKPFMDAFPKQKMAQHQWRKKGEAWIQGIVKQDEVFLMASMKEEHQELFMEVTKRFLQDARLFDSSLSIEDIGQAMRNVWIIVILQCIFAKHTGYHKAMFAYSMLYPYSDNYLDDAAIDIEEKKQFNAWFTKRLKGESVELRNEHQKKISALVDMIEEVFPREDYPEVFTSLLWIQEAQVLSLLQQDGNQRCSLDKLLAISYQKGGTSVVADGFLIDGELKEEEMRFCMQYGFMLQIGDDLQDATNDVNNHHQTLISTSLHMPLDAVFMKLVQYTKDILAPSIVCEDAELLDFVLKDCLLLLFIAVVDTKQYYSDSLYQEVLRCLPFSSTFLNEMKEKTQWEYTEEELWKRFDCLLFDCCR